MIHLKRPIRARYMTHMTPEELERETNHSQTFINEQIAEVLASQEAQIREMSAAIRTLANELGKLQKK